MYISWQIWNHSVGALQTSYRRRYKRCTTCTVPMHCTFIRRLRTGSGHIQPINCQMTNGNSNWTATGSGIRPGDVMRGTAIGIVLTRSVTGIINWDSSTEHPTRMQAIFALLMKKAGKLLRSYYAVLVSRKETVRRYCWGCL